MLVYICLYHILYLYHIIVIVIGHKYIDTMDDTMDLFWVDRCHVSPVQNVSAFRYKLHHLTGRQGRQGSQGWVP